MKKVFVVVAIVVLLFSVGWFLFKKVGNIAPALLPPLKQNTQTTNTSNLQGAPLDFPLTVAQGMTISSFAKNLGSVRDLEFSPDGTLLASVPSQGKVVAVTDGNQDGQSDEAKDVVSGLDNPHGMVFHDGKLFIAEETRVVRYNWDENNLTASEDKVLFSLPAGGRHSTRTLAFNKQGQLFISIGSTCDVCFEKHPFLTTVVVSDAEGATPRVFAKGLRNAVFITVDPQTDLLWGTEMGRDFLGDETPPDEVNILKDGADYGWPVCYGDKIYDKNFNQRTPSYCDATQAPAYKIAAHSAPLGLTFINSSQFPADWQGDLLVAYHGSWNRSTPIGYNVVRMNVEGDTITSEEDFITGFLPQGASQAAGRPVDVVFDQAGNLFVSDDKAGVIYLVTK